MIRDRDQILNRIKIALDHLESISHLESQLKFLDRVLSQAASELQDLRQMGNLLKQRSDKLEFRLNQLISGEWDLIRSLDSRISDLEFRYAGMGSARLGDEERMKLLESRRKAMLEDALDLARSYHKAGLLSDEEYQQMLKALKESQAQRKTFSDV